MARLFGIVIAGVAFCFILSGAEAQGTKKIDVDVVFKKLDANSDGKLSKDEFLKLADRFKDKEKAREKLTKAFETIDPQNKGLTKDQFGQYLDSVKKKVMP